MLAGIKEIKQVMADAAKAAELHSRTILFIDEIHRFNKAQQDAFLPYVERGTIRLIGATTENPSFEVISALLSRCRVYVLEPLKEEQIVTLLARALEDKERGLGALWAYCRRRRAPAHRRLLQRRLPLMRTTHSKSPPNWPRPSSVIPTKTGFRRAGLDRARPVVRISTRRDRTLAAGKPSLVSGHDFSRAEDQPK